MVCVMCSYPIGLGKCFHLYIGMITRKVTKLDDFVGSHPELFVIEGDFIQLKEGAQEIIAATIAFAKVKAAASATSSHSSLLPSVAVTPMAQPYCLKKEHAIYRSGNLTDNHSHARLMNGVPYVVGAVSTVMILSKSNDIAAWVQSGAGLILILS